MKTEIKEADYIKAFFLFWLCATVAGFIGGAIIGGILGAAMGVAGVPIRTIQIICGIAGFLISVPSILSVFPDFRVALYRSEAHDIRSRRSESSAYICAVLNVLRSGPPSMPAVFARAVNIFA